MNNWSPWDGIIKESGWLKLPEGVWPFFRGLGFVGMDFPVLFYFFSRAREGQLEIKAYPQDLITYSGGNRKSCYSALSKMKSYGLEKTAPFTYNMEPFLDQLRSISLSIVKE